MSIIESKNNTNNNIADSINSFNLDNCIIQLKKCKFLPENIVLELIEKV